MYLLDSNTCIALLNQSHAGAAARIRQCRPEEVLLCSVVKSELLYGARHSQRVQANLQLLAQFFAPLPSLPFDDRCAEEAAMIRADLAIQGQPIGSNDLLIAATARAHDAVLVTHNTREFVRVAGLRLEDWLA
ncbi:MAG: type II toxin-antitoxin system VapC family toxin [Thermomonas sp.]|uniref:type II toxin-antitoxin system VapC family toxin n=1 Tax=Thermomonas sp. TaxID=1971895 RepID=UPI0039E55F4F